MPDGKRIVGYCDPLSVGPGQTVRFMVSSSTTSLSMRRSSGSSAETSPRTGTGSKSTRSRVTWRADTRGHHQRLRPGSYALVDPHPVLAGLESFRIEVDLWPTRLDGRRQVLASTLDGSGGFALALDPGGRPVIEAGDGSGGRVSLRADEPLATRRWTHLTAVYSIPRAWPATASCGGSSPSRRDGPLGHGDWSSSATLPGAAASTRSPGMNVEGVEVGHHQRARARRHPAPVAELGEGADHGLP